jgi:hypothetical protein
MKTGEKEIRIGMFGVSLALTISVLLSATPSVSQSRYPVVVGKEKDIKMILNPSYPRDGRFMARMARDMSLGGASTVAAGLLNRPISFEVDDKGFVYVMDWGDCQIKVFDEAGGYVRSIGRKGQGPGEFQTPASFDLMAQDRLCVHDAMQKRILVFSSDGQCLSMLSHKESYSGIRADGQGRLFLDERVPIDEPIEKLPLSKEYRLVPYRTRVYRTDNLGKEFSRIADFEGESVAMMSMGQGAISGSRSLYTILWCVSRQGRLFGGYSEHYLLGCYGARGEIECYFGRQFPYSKNTRFKGPFARIKTLPVFRQIWVDDQERLWIELYREEEDQNILYDVFSPEGVYLMRVEADRRIFRIRKQHAYGMSTTDDGEIKVERYTLGLVPAS